MKILLLGKPGSGKGTYAKELAKRYSLPHISTGDVVRGSNSELGQKAREYANKGELVPDEIIIELFKERMAQDDLKEGFILEGFPRTLNQATLLKEIMEFNFVFNMDLSDEAIIKRQSSRRNCPKCGRIYNLITVLKPKVGETCDDCNVDLFHRADDTQTSIKIRLDEYDKKTAPVLEIFEHLNIDASGTVEEVMNQIYSKIE